MKLSELKDLLTNEVELNKFIAENCPADVIHSTHPVIEIFSGCEGSDDVKDKEGVAELILQVFGSSLSVSDLVFITNKFPSLIEKAFNCFLGNLTDALRISLEELVCILANESDILDFKRDLISDSSKDPDSVNNTIVRCLIFKLGLHQLNPDIRLALLKKTLADENLSRALYTKEAGVIYGQHPVTADLQKCHGANYSDLAQVAEMVVIKYGNQLIFTDFEYLCERFPQAREKIFANFVTHIAEEDIEKHLPAILQLKKENELIPFIMVMIQSIVASERGSSYFKNKRLMAAFTISLKFIDISLAKVLFATYIKPLFLNSEIIFAAGFNLTHMSKYLSLLCQFLPDREVIEIVGASSSTIVLGTPDGMNPYLVQISSVVPKPFFLHLLDKISQTYSRLEKKEITSPNPQFQQWSQFIAPKYRAKVDEYFQEFNGSSIEDFRHHEKQRRSLLKHESTLAGVTQELGIFATKESKPAVANTPAATGNKLSC
jgi:hypothetical protein